MEYNIDNTVKDFIKFIELIEEKHPALTERKELLGKKALFDLNLVLANKVEGIKPTANQDKYPVIDLMFNLALASGLFVKKRNKSWRRVLVSTLKLKSFLSLNTYEQYVYLLQTYWTSYDFYKYFEIWPEVSEFCQVLHEISKANEGDKIKTSEKTRGIFGVASDLLYHLEFFGIGQLELIENAENVYKKKVEWLEVKEFGIKVCKFLMEKLAYLNADEVEVFLYEAGLNGESIHVEDYFQVFKYLFKDKGVTKTVEEIMKPVKNGTYTFRVSIVRNSMKSWREVQLAYTHTLEDLHNIIQEAFHFDNDHLYGFFLDNRDPILCKYAEDYGEVAEKTKIASLRLYEGQEFVYIFDFGDEWRFKVEVINIDNKAPLPLKPMIMHTKGMAPEQY